MQCWKLVDRSSITLQQNKRHQQHRGFINHLYLMQIQHNVRKPTCGVTHWGQTNIIYASGELCRVDVIYLTHQSLFVNNNLYFWTTEINAKQLLFTSCFVPQWRENSPLSCDFLYSKCNKTVQRTKDRPWLFRDSTSVLTHCLCSLLKLCSSKVTLYVRSPEVLTDWSFICYFQSLCN